MKRGPTSLTSWTRTIKKSLDQSGYDGLALMRQADMDPALLNDPDARYTLQQTNTLWALAITATSDPAFGLRVASAVTTTTFHALGYMLAASSSLSEMFERIIRYFRFVIDSTELELRLEDDEYHFLIHIPARGPQPAIEEVDAFISVFVRTCRAMAGTSYNPLRIELIREAPGDASAFHRVLRVPLHFGGRSNRIVFDRASFERPLEGGNPALAMHNDAIVLRYLSRFAPQNIIAKVKAAVIEQLPKGEPSQSRIAASLNMSLRALQRKMAEEGSRYQDVLDSTRRELAISYVLSGVQRITDIAYYLGFSDTSSFTRAFRRWTGVPPSQYRESGAVVLRNQKV